jgi:hypothetical protein
VSSKLLTGVGARQGGVAGLIMRLSEDGHRDMHVCGPPGETPLDTKPTNKSNAKIRSAMSLILKRRAGTVDLLHGLRHFVRWRHPRILITEFDPGGKDTVFEVRLTILQMFHIVFCTCCVAMS